jgi:adenine-specific DNA-methyltransferase
LNYIGSKHTLLPFIESTLDRLMDGSDATACDIFAGTGAVGRLFKRKGLRVIANDIQHYAYVLNRAYIQINSEPDFTALAQSLLPSGSPAPDLACTPRDALGLVSSIPGVPGFISSTYGPDGDRRYFTRDNAERTDAIRQAIEGWRGSGVITEDGYYYILCALLEAIDEVANTASVYGAYLKRFKKTALKPLALEPFEVFDGADGCLAMQMDANELVGQIDCDILYIDPPYNHRQYGANYHVLETIARYDAPETYGVSGLRDYISSDYCKRNHALAAFEDLIGGARAKHILVSYSDEGILSLGQIKDTLSKRGDPITYAKAYSRYKADNGREYIRDATVEYLHHVRVVR